MTSVAVSGSKVAFIGVGEKLGDLQQFDPTRFVAQLVGFPDLQSLLEKMKEASDEEKLQKAMMRIAGDRLGQMARFAAA